jgi:hypothetical protein
MFDAVQAAEGGAVVRGAERTSEVAGRFPVRLWFIAALLAAGSCAATPAAVRSAEIVRRGVLLARGWSVAPLAKGPALVHVYSEAAGGVVYIAPAAAGAERDCTLTGPTAGVVQAPLLPDRRLTVAIRDGEVVCLYTQARRTVEVLWHAHRVSPVAPEYRMRSATLAAKP